MFTLFRVQLTNVTKGVDQIHHQDLIQNLNLLHFYPIISLMTVAQNCVVTSVHIGHAHMRLNVRPAVCLKLLSNKTIKIGQEMFEAAVPAPDLWG